MPEPSNLSKTHHNNYCSVGRVLCTHFAHTCQLVLLIQAKLKALQMVRNVPESLMEFPDNPCLFKFVLRSLAKLTNSETNLKFSKSSFIHVMPLVQSFILFSLLSSSKAHLSIHHIYPSIGSNMRSPFMVAGTFIEKTHQSSFHYQITSRPHNYCTDLLVSVTLIKSDHSSFYSCQCRGPGSAPPTSLDTTKLPFTKITTITDVVTSIFLALPRCLCPSVPLSLCLCLCLCLCLSLSPSVSLSLSLYLSLSRCDPPRLINQWVSSTKPRYYIFPE